MMKPGNEWNKMCKEDLRTREGRGGVEYYDVGFRIQGRKNIMVRKSWKMRRIMKI